MSSYDKEAMRLQMSRKLRMLSHDDVLSKGESYVFRQKGQPVAINALGDTPPL